MIEINLLVPEWALWTTGSLLYFLVAILLARRTYRRLQRTYPQFDAVALAAVTGFFWPLLPVGLFFLALFYLLTFHNEDQ